MNSGEKYFIHFEDLMETEEPLIRFRGFPATGNEATSYAKLLDGHEDGLLIERVAVCSVIIINLCVGGFFLSSAQCS